MTKVHETKNGIFYFNDSQMQQEGGELNDLPLEYKMQIMGGTGTRFHDGYIQEEYNNKFSDTQAFVTYDEMYRSDSTIFKTLFSAEVSILSSNWHIQPGSDKDGVITEKDKEIAEMVRQSLFEEIDWSQFMEECIKFLRDGVSVFEKVYKIKDGKIVLDKLAVRLPRSIMRRQTKDGTRGITQTLPNTEATQKEKKINPSIPAEKLLLFTFRQEGKNYAGMSILRPVAKNWIAKKALENYELIGFETQFKGVRKLRIPPGTNKKDKKTFVQSVGAFEIGNDNVVLCPGTPDKYDFEFVTMDLPQAEQLANAIKRHDSKISDILLAIFMKLGESERGSYGMSESGMEFFYKGLQVIANKITNVINKYLIKELVDMNYDGVVNYPKLSYGRLGKVDISNLSSAIQRLAQTKMITRTLATEQRIREAHGLPKITEDEREEQQRQNLENLKKQEGKQPQSSENPQNKENKKMSFAEFGDGGFYEYGCVYGEIPYVMDLKHNVSNDDVIKREHQRHITLLFGLHKGVTLADVTKSLEGEQSLVLNITGINYFPNQEGDVVYYEVESEDAQRYHNKLAKLPNTQTHENYTPHITIAYCFSGTGMKYQRTFEKPVKLIVDRIHFSNSDGVKAIMPTLNLHEHCNHNDEYFSIVDGNRYTEPSEDLTAQELEKLKKKDSGKNKFRPLTFAEKKVDLDGIKKKLQEFEKNFADDLKNLTEKQKKDVLKQINNAVANNDLKALQGVKAKYLSELTDMILKYRKEMFEYGKEKASLELGAKRVATRAEQKAFMKLESELLAKKLVDNIDNATKTTVSELVGKNNGDIKMLATGTAVAEVGQVFDNVVSKGKSSLQTLSIVGSFNIGRSVSYEANSDKIYAYQYSAILDGKTTDRCLSLDGRVVMPGSAEYQLYKPPQHHNCRSIRVAILIDETFKPKVTGIPKSIKPTQSLGNVSDLKRPYILKDSPAVEQIQKEIKERRQKLAQYQTDKKFPNRQKAHQQRINELEKTLRRIVPSM